MSGANNLNRQGSKKAMSCSRRDLHNVKEILKIGGDGTGVCYDEDVDVVGKGGCIGGGRACRTNRS